MITQFFSLAFIALFGAMLPGPDFAIVTKNTILHSRKSGYFTSLGIGSGTIIHMSYCLLGLALVISESILIFNIIKYIGATYLIYLGITALLAKKQNKIATSTQPQVKKQISAFTAFKQGFLCNLLNPKATLFFLSLFTVLIKPETPLSWQIIFASEVTIIGTLWFCFLSNVFSHPAIKVLLEKAEKYIEKVLGGFLIFFGIALAFVKNS